MNAIGGEARLGPLNHEVLIMRYHEVLIMKVLIMKVLIMKVLIMKVLIMKVLIMKQYQLIQGTLKTIVMADAIKT